MFRRILCCSGRASCRTLRLAYLDGDCPMPKRAFRKTTAGVRLSDAVWTVSSFLLFPRNIRLTSFSLRQLVVSGIEEIRRSRIFSLNFRQLSTGNSISWCFLREGNDNECEKRKTQLFSSHIFQI